MSAHGNNFRSLALTFAAGAVLAACSGSAGVISSHEISSVYDDLQVGYVTRDNRAIPVMIAGNPFNSQRADVDDAILQAMNGSNFGPEVTFAVDPVKPATEKSRVVLAFNPNERPAPGGLCLAVPKSRPNAGDTLYVNAAYCQGSEALTEATGRIQGANSPLSKNFETIMVQLTQALFPPNNPNLNEGEDACNNC